MLEQVLVPLDGSSLAECVLPHVVAICSALESQVTLLHVLERNQSFSDTQTIDPLEWHIQKTEGTQYLTTISSRLQNLGISTQMEVLEGRAAETIVDFAAQRGIQLIFLSTHGKSGLSEWNISSTVQKIILRGGKSILLTRASQSVPIGEVQYRKILVPLDGSLRAEHVLPIANMLSMFHNATLVLAHVVTKPAVPRRAPLTQEEISLVEGITHLNQREGQRYLEQLEAQSAPRAKMHLLVNENPVVALHNLVEQEQIDLVLFNAHGLSGESRWPYGSLVTHFMMYGTTPLFIVQDFPVEAMSRPLGGAALRTAHLLR